MIFKSGATSQSVDVQIVDDSGLAVTGLTYLTASTIKYSVAGANADVTITLVTLAAITTAWASGGFIERGNGVYRLDVPNAALSSVGEVTLRAEASGQHLISPRIVVIQWDMSNGSGGRPNINVDNCTTGVFLTSHFNNDAVAGLSGTWLYSSASTTPTTGPTRWVQYYGTPTYNGKVVLIGYAGNVYMWWDSTNSLWTISTTIGTRGSAYFTATDPLGTWTAGGTATGSPSFVGSGFPIDNYFSKLKVNSSGNVGADLQSILGSAITGTASYISAAFSTMFNVASSVFTTASVNQGGDAYGRIGAAGAGLTSIGDTRLANLDANVSSRSTYAGADTSGTTTLLGRVTSTRAGNLDYLDAAVSSRSTYAGGDTAGTTTLLGRVTGLVPLASDYTSARATKLDHLDADISSRSTYAGGDTSGTSTLVGLLTSARCGYLDNLNVGGNVASHADVVAISTSSSRRIILQTAQQYAPSEAYTIEVRTYSASGSAVNADSNPTLSVTGTISGSLSAHLGTITNPATGLYRWTYTVPSSPTLEQIMIDVSATISSSTFTMSAYPQTVDSPTAVITPTIVGQITAIYNKLPTNNMADQTLVMAALPTIDGSGRVTLNPTQPSTLVIDTVTHLTNAPTIGDFSATMKTSLNAATPTVTAGTVTDKSGYSLTSAYDAAKTAAAPGAKMDIVDAPNSTGLAAIGSAVWSISTRILTAFGFTVNTNANSTETAIKAKTDLIATNSADSPNASTAQTSIASIQTTVNALPSASSIAASVWSAATRTLSAFGFTVNTNANSTETAIQTTVNALPSASSIASAVWGATTRTLSAFGFTVNTNANSTETAIQTAVAGLPSSVPTAVQIRQEMDANSTRLLAEATASGLTAAVTTLEAALAAANVGEVTSLSGGALASIKSYLAGTVIAIRGPVFFDDDGQPTITLGIGCDYSAADGQQIEFVIDGSELPDLTGCSAILVCESKQPKGRSVYISGSAIVPTGATRTIRFEPAAADTGQLKTTADGTFYVSILTAAGRRSSPIDARGTLVVVPGQVPNC